MGNIKEKKGRGSRITTYTIFTEIIIAIIILTSKMNNSKCLIDNKILYEENNIDLSG